MPDELKPILARQMEVYAGFLEHTDHHVGRLVDALDDLGVLEDTLVYYIVGDNGASAEGDDQRHLQRDVHLQRRRGARDPRVHGRAHRRLRHAEGLQPLSRSAGRTRWTRPTSGPSRSPRTGAERATARSSTGRAGSPAKGEMRAQFHHVIDVAPTVLEAAGLPAADDRQWGRPTADRGREHGVLVRRCDRGRPPRDAVLRDVLQPRHLPPGLDRGHQPQRAVGGGGRSAAVRGRRLGALRHEHGLEPGARPRRRDAGEAGRAATALARGGPQVQRAPARRPSHRALQRRARRPPGAREGKLAAALRRHGTPQREHVLSTSRTSPTRSRRRSSCPRPAPRA